MPNYVEMSINGVIHESELIGAAMPPREESVNEEHDD